VSVDNLSRLLSDMCRRYCWTFRCEHCKQEFNTKANIAASKKVITLPFVEIHYLEGKTQEQKEKLAKAITEAVTAIFEVPSDVVWIQFDEMSKTDFATGGVMRSKR